MQVHSCQWRSSERDWKGSSCFVYRSVAPIHGLSGYTHQGERSVPSSSFVDLSVVEQIDPYINIDAGTMSPFEHGEVFVLDDGGEVHISAQPLRNAVLIRRMLQVDLDLGNYERFVDINLTRGHNITTGKVCCCLVM